LLTGQTREWIFTHDRSEDVKSRKDVAICLLGVIKLKFNIKTLYLIPQNRQNMVENGTVF